MLANIRVDLQQQQNAVKLCFENIARCKSARVLHVQVVCVIVRSFALVTMEITLDL